MTENQIKSDYYFVNSSHTLQEGVTILYESCYDENGMPKDADKPDIEMINSALDLLSKVKEVMESWGKLVEITVEDEQTKKK